jgi:hypothetical protein
LLHREDQRCHGVEDGRQIQIDPGKTMQPSYRHTQTNFLFALILILALFAAILLVVDTHYGVDAMVLYILLAIVLMNYLTQTVEVKADKIEVRFGPGIFRRTIALDRIYNLCVVENPQQGRQGVQLIASGLITTVAGKQAVEIVLDDESQVRIGTDEPVALARAIEKALIETRRK